MSNDQLAASTSWVNGEPVDNISISDRGLAYGDGVFETILINAKGPVLFDAHLERLCQGLRQLAIEADPGLLGNELRDYMGECGPEPKIIKYIVTRGQGGRGYGAAGTKGPNRILSRHPAPQYPKSYCAQGIRLFACKSRLGHDPRLAKIKHLNRLPQVLARAEWNDSRYQEGLLQDLDGNVIEGVFSNVFVVVGDEIKTPNLDRCGVEGVMAQWLKTQFRSNGVIVAEANISLQEFEQAQEVFLCNSVYGVWPVAQFKQRHWAAGKVAAQASSWVEEQWGL